MFIFETVAKLVLITIFLSGHFAGAQTPTVYTPTCEVYWKSEESAQAELDQAQDAGKPQNVISRIEAKLKRAQDAHEDCRKSTFKNGHDCNNADENFNKAMTDFSSACGEANLGGDCATEVVKCRKSDKGDLYSDGGRRRDINRPHDVDGVAKQCPAMAGKDIEKLEKEVKEYKEKLQKLDKEMPELRDKANTKRSKLNDKQQELTKEMSDKNKKLSDELQKLSEDRDASEKAITDQVTNITAQIAKAQDALSQVAVTKLEGQLKLKQAKVQADLNCHAQASAQVAKMQNDVVEGMKAGTFNGGGFSKHMKRVGLSDRQQWQKVANKYYKWCLDSKPTMDTKEGANDGYRLLLKQSRQSENSIREQVRQLKAQQQTLIGGACSGQVSMQANGSNGGETAMCQAARKAYERSNKLKQDFLEDQNNARQKYMNIAQEGQQEMQTLQQQYQEKAREISNEKSYLDNLQKYLQAKYDHSGGNSNVDGKGLAKALALLTSVEASSRKLIQCDFKEFSKSNPTGTWNCDGNCEVAQQFLVKITEDRYSPDLVPQRAAASPRGENSLAIDGGGGSSTIPASTKSGSGTGRR